MNRFRTPGPWTFVAVLLLVGCGDSSTGPDPVNDPEISIEVPFQGILIVGDHAQLGSTLSDPSVPGTVLWSSTDTSVAWVNSAGRLRAQRPGTATVSARLQGAEAELPVTVAARPGGYTAAEIDYLQEIAFGFEYGSATAVIRKWAVNPKLRVNGSPTAEDLTVLQDIVGDLNALMEEVQVEIVTSDPAVEIHYAPIAQFPTILRSYVTGNLGYFSVWFDVSNHIYRSVVLLASDVANQAGRTHLAREEIT